MRFGPIEVNQWFAGEVSSDGLDANLARLQSDPNWRVTDLHGASRRTLNLLYFPTGQRLEVVLQRIGQRWRRQ